MMNTITLNNQSPMSNGRIGSPISVEPMNNENNSIIRKIPKAHLAMVLSEKCLGEVSLSTSSSMLMNRLATLFNLTLNF